MADRRQQGFDDFDADQNRGDFNDGEADVGQADMPEPEMPEPVASVPEPEVPEVVNQGSNNLKESVSSKMDSAASSIKGAFSKFDSKRAMSITLTTIAVLAVSAVVVVSLWYMMKKGAVKTMSHLLAES